MSQTQSGFSFEQHQLLGATLKRMDKDLADCLCACTGAFSLQSDPVKKGQKAMAALRDLRIALDTELASAFPDKDAKELGSVYIDATDA